MKELCLLWCDFCQDLNFSEREIKADNLEHTSPGKHWILEQPYGRSCQVKGNEDGKTAEGREKGGSGAGQPQHMSVRTPESLETGRPVSQDRQSSSDWVWQCNPSTHSLFLLLPPSLPPPIPTDDKRYFWTHQSDRMEKSSERLNVIRFLLESLSLYAT